MKARYILPLLVVLASGCSGEWEHPYKSSAQIKLDCRECESQAALTSADRKSTDYKAAYYECMKGMNYQLVESDFSNSLKITAVVISILVGLSLGAG